MIKDIINSPVKNKKYRAIMSDGSKIDFGLKSSITYLDHKDKKKEIIIGLDILEMIGKTILLKIIFHLRPYYPIIYYGVHTLLYIKILIT
jgi:hypothetical protein